MTTSRKKIILKYRVTFLEMNNRPKFSYPSLPIKNVLLLESIDVSLWYFISLYKEIGYRYEWTDIFKQSSTKTNDFIKNKDVNFFSLLHKGTPIGFFILDYRNFNICELSYIGITNEHLGKGLGKYIFKTAILTAWDKRKIIKLKVNTCSLDHKAALPLYQKLGFKPVNFQEKKRKKTFFN